MTYYQDTEPKNPKVGDLWEKNGETYRWDGKRWVKVEYDIMLDELYDYADVIVGSLNRRNIGTFDQLKTLPKKQVIVIETVNEVYSKADEMARNHYLRLAKKVARRLSELMDLEDLEDDITMFWLLTILEGYDPITKYVYTHEVDRKRARMIEAILASDNTAKEVDSGLKSWTRQVKQYADNVVDEVIKYVYKKHNVYLVMWNTEQDMRVCSICDMREGNIYELKDAPLKPHYGCRCYLTPVKDASNGRETTQ